MLKDEHGIVTETVYKFRKLTNNYTPPSNACTSHHVILSKLKELDHELAQQVVSQVEINYHIGT